MQHIVAFVKKKLPKDSTNVDHIGNIQDWLKTLGLPRCLPESKVARDKKNYFKHIKDEDFKKVKEEYLTTIIMLL